MKKLIYTLLFPLIIVLSCKKIVDIKTPPNALYPSAIFSDSTNLKSAVMGMYSVLAFSQSYYTSGTALNSLYADETTSISNSSYLDNALLPSEAQLSIIWNEHYSAIYRANAIIEGVQSSTVLSATTKKQALGEAYFIRAFCHFMLLNIYGNIPLITTTNVSANAIAPQASSDAVYQQIVSDLQMAISDLPANYSVSGNERTRANQLVAVALLAKVYLYKKDWAKAEQQSNLIITNPLFTLPTDLSKVFINTSKEAIFQFDTRPTGYVAFAQLFVPTADVQPTYIIRPELSNAFESNALGSVDLRKQSWIGISAGYPFPYKYKNTITGSSTLEYGTILRLADLYLIHAEACAHDPNKILDAQNDINAVRHRAGLDNTTATGQASLLLAIEQERRVELFCEYGNRFFDLKRTGRLDAVLGVEKTGWKSTAANYPIPGVEISKNPNLKQNPGY